MKGNERENMKDFKKSKACTMIISIVVGLVLSFVLIFSESVSIKNGLKDFFSTFRDKYTTFLRVGVNVYLSESDEIQSADIDKRETVLKLNGGPLEDGYQQMRCYVSLVTSGMNCNDFKTITGKPAISDANLLFNQDGELIELENTMLLIRQDPDGKSTIGMFYTFDDSSVISELDRLLGEENSNRYDLLIHIEDAYLKGNTFVPARVEYVDRDDEGKTVIPIYTLDKDKDAMESDGYEYYEIDTTFECGDVFGDGDYVTYVGSVDEEVKARSKEMLDQALLRNNVDSVVYEDHGPFEVEFFKVTGYSAPDVDETYYLASYERANTLYYLRVGDHLPMPGPWFLIIASVEFVLIMTFSLVAGNIVYKKRNK